MVLGPSCDVVTEHIGVGLGLFRIQIRRGGACLSLGTVPHRTRGQDPARGRGARVRRVAARVLSAPLRWALGRVQANRLRLLH